MLSARHIRISLVLTTLISLVLSGCGGKDEADESGQQLRGGSFTGTVSSTILFRGVILPNQEVWLLEGREIDGAFSYGDWIQATLVDQSQNSTSKNAVLVGEMAQVPGVLSLDPQTNDSLVKGVFTSSEFGYNKPFEGTSGSSSSTNWLYRFDAGASAASIQGTWVMPSGRRTIGMTLEVAPNGEFSGTGSFGGLPYPPCDISGRLTPSSSGKNFFEVSLSRIGESCFAISTLTAGIAITYPLANGQSELVLSFVGSNPTRTKVAWRMVARR
jgi:hypothetical protein